MVARVAQLVDDMVVERHKDGGRPSRPSPRRSTALAPTRDPSYSSVDAYWMTLAVILQPGHKWFFFDNSQTLN